MAISYFFWFNLYGALYFQNILLHLCAEITSGFKHNAVVDISTVHLWCNGGRGHMPLACRKNGWFHVFRRQHEFIPVIIHSLRCAIASVGSCIGIVVSHCTTFGSYVLTYLYLLGVYAKNILFPVNGSRNILAYFLGEPCCQLAAGIKLPPAD